MTSLTAGVALLLLGLLLGISLSKKISDKKQFYKALISFNQDLLIEVEFQRNDLSCLLNRKYSSEDFNRILTQKNEVVKGDCREIVFPKYLNEGEQFELKEYFNKIGMQDSYTASIFLKRYGEIFSCLHADVI